RAWSCYSAFRIPHSAFLAVGVFLALQAPDPWLILDRASATYQTITILSAEFVQIITNPMIGTPDTTRGRLYQMRPSRFAMRFTAPKVIASWLTVASSGSTRRAPRPAR